MAAVQLLQLASRTRVQIQTVSEPSRQLTVGREARVDIGGGWGRRRWDDSRLDSSVLRYVEVYGQHCGQLAADEGDKGQC